MGFSDCSDDLCLAPGMAAPSAASMTLSLAPFTITFVVVSTLVKCRHDLEMNSSASSPCVRIREPGIDDKILSNLESRGLWLGIRAGGEPLSDEPKTSSGRSSQDRLSEGAGTVGGLLADWGGRLKAVHGMISSKFENLRWPKVYSQLNNETRLGGFRCC